MTNQLYTIYQRFQGRPDQGFGSWVPTCYKNLELAAANTMLARLEKEEPELRLRNPGTEAEYQVRPAPSNDLPPTYTPWWRTTPSTQETSYRQRFLNHLTRNGFDMPQLAEHLSITYTNTNPARTQVRFEIRLPGHLPICQYVEFEKGGDRIQARKEWFVPVDGLDTDDSQQQTTRPYPAISYQALLGTLNRFR